MSNIKIDHTDAPYFGAVAITPSDSADLTDPVSAIFVGVAGNITVDMAGVGTNITFANVPVGVFRVCVTKVYATGTAATNLVGLK